MRRVWTLGWVVLAAACGNGGALALQTGGTGTLDPDFGANGLALFDSGGADEFRDMTLDAAGRVLVAGNVRDGRDDLVVGRYAANGTPDASFGTGGFVVHASAAGGAGHDRGYAIVVAPDGKIVVAGLSENAAGDWDVAVWRFLGDGSLDPSFGAAGFVTRDGDGAAAGGTDRAFSVAVDAAGRVVVGGTSGADYAIWRFLPDGTPDPAFAGDGALVIADPAGGGGLDQIYSLALDAAGRIVATGKSASPAGPNSMVLVRVRADGTLDPTFGAGGIVVYADSASVNGEPDVIGRNVRVDDAGRIVVVGWTAAPRAETFLWRYGADGTPDASFGANGLVVFDGSVNNGRVVAFDVAGRILVAGYVSGGVDVDLALWRCEPDGALDAGFGRDGLVRHRNAAGGAGDDQANAVAIDAFGRIVLAGVSEGPVDGDAVVWRYVE